MFPQSSGQGVKLFQTFFTIPGVNYDLPCKEPMFNRLIALRATVRFPCAVLGPVERSAFLRLAWTLRSETGRLRPALSREDCLDKSFKGSY